MKNPTIDELIGRWEKLLDCPCKDCVEAAYPELAKAIAIIRECRSQRDYYIREEVGLSEAEIARCDQELVLKGGSN